MSAELLDAYASVTSMLQLRLFKGLDRVVTCSRDFGESLGYVVVSCYR